MTSPENARVRSLYEGLVASLAPTETTTPGIPEFRAGYEQLCAELPIVEGTPIRSESTGGVPGLRVGEDAAGATVVLWFHGGGYVIGSAEGTRSFASEVASVTDGLVVVPEYRLAPEHPYPAASDDGIAAYKGLLEEGIDPDAIVVGGDSAGGGLALSTLARARDESLPLPRAGVLLSPWADLTLSGPSLAANVDRDPVISPAMLGMLGPLYHGAEDPAHPRLSPLLGDLAGLPPLLVFVGTEEGLYDDAVRVVEGVRAAGGSARLEIGEGMFHIYPSFAAILPEGRDALRGMAAFVAAPETARA